MLLQRRFIVVAAAFASMFTVFGVAYAAGDGHGHVGLAPTNGRDEEGGQWRNHQRPDPDPRNGDSQRERPPAPEPAADGRHHRHVPAGRTDPDPDPAAAAAERPPLSSEAVTSLGTAVRTRQFGLIYLSGVLVSFGLFFAFVHLVPYAMRQGIPAVQAAGLIGVIGIGSAVARIGLSAAAGRIGVLAGFKVSLLILAASFAVWLLSGGYAGLALFALLLGLGYGGWVALSPAVIAEIFGARGMGGTVGVLYTAAALGGLIGPVAGGYAVDVSGGYRVPIIAALLLSIAGLALVATLRAGGPVHSKRVVNAEEVASGS